MKELNGMVYSTSPMLHVYFSLNVIMYYCSLFDRIIIQKSTLDRITCCYVSVN